MAEYSISTATGLEDLVTESLIQSLQPTQISTYLALGSGYNTHFFYTTKDGCSIGLVYSKISAEFNHQNSIIKDMSMKRLVMSKRIKESAVIIQKSVDISEIDGVKTMNYQFAIQLEF